MGNIDDRTIVEYARTFKVSDMTIRRRIKTGKLHAILQDGKYFIPVSANGVAHRPGLGEQRLAERSAQLLPQGQTDFAFLNGNGRMPSSSSAEPHVIKSTHIGSKASLQFQVNESEIGKVGEGVIPGSLTRPLLSHETSLVDTRALLAYCEATLKKVTENERRTVEKFKSKLETLEAVLSGRDLEIKALRQQLEDLQLLVKILERKKTA